MATMGGVFLSQIGQRFVINLFPIENGAYALDAYRAVFGLQALFCTRGPASIFGARPLAQRDLRWSFRAQMFDLVDRSATLTYPLAFGAIADAILCSAVMSSVIPTCFLCGALTSLLQRGKRADLSAPAALLGRFLPRLGPPASRQAAGMRKWDAALQHRTAGYSAAAR